jgi:hypothetical protein
MIYRPAPARKCRVCGVSFRPFDTNSRSRHCSADCADEGERCWRAENRERLIASTTEWSGQCGDHRRRLVARYCKTIGTGKTPRSQSNKQALDGNKRGRQ